MSVQDESGQGQAGRLPRQEPDGHRRRKPIRVTARAFVVHDGHVLLLRAEDPGRPWVFLPGGGAEHGETLADACRREVLEETGIHVVVERPIYLREFIAGRHQRRSVFMPPDNHAVALIFLCRPEPERYAGVPLEAIGEFPGDVDGTGATLGMFWHPIGEPLQVESMPPHVARVVSSRAFPPGPEQGIVHWPEE